MSTLGASSGTIATLYSAAPTYSAEDHLYHRTCLLRHLTRHICPRFPLRVCLSTCTEPRRVTTGSGDDNEERLHRRARAWGPCPLERLLDAGWPARQVDLTAHASTQPMYPSPELVERERPGKGFYEWARGGATVLTVSVLAVARRRGDPQQRDVPGRRLRGGDRFLR